MLIFKKMDWMAQSLLISLAAFLLPLLLMSDKVPHTFIWVLLSLIIGLVVLTAAWMDDPQPCQSFHVKFSGVNTVLMICFSLALIATSVFQ